jgi:hypothetical protein
MIVNFDGSVVAHGTTGRPDEIITAEVRPDLVREARINWGVENNIYQLWHRGYVAVKGGAMDCPYTFMQDMVAGTFRLPWEDQVKITDGTSCGCAADPDVRRREGGGMSPRRPASRDDAWTSPRKGCGAPSAKPLPGLWVRLSPGRRE